MNPVVGVDVAKGASVVQAFLQRNKPFGKSKQIRHTPHGFEQLHALLKQLQRETNQKPKIILEPTGHYHRILVLYLKDQGYEVILVNPLQSHRAKQTGLRKVKTDAADAWHLGQLYYQQSDWTTQRRHEEDRMDLQYLTRQLEFITGLYVQAKLNMGALLDQVFPTYPTVFKDVYSKVSLNLLEASLSDSFSDYTFEQWASLLRKSAVRTPAETWITEKVQRLQTAILQNPVRKIPYGLERALQSMIGCIRVFQEQMTELEKLIEATSATVPDVLLLESIPGIGTKLAAVIAAELGDISQFNHPKQVVAFAGIDPSVFSSGQFVASENRITKRGSKRLRRAVYLAVTCGLRKDLNSRIKPYYDKKKSEGKPHKVAVIACANKLLHHIYSILRKREPYAL
ncbi:IS110 family transposase [Paenibacillus kribbensis]|uniref:IS110 family transposase n=1 Tax=Paenibacillus kribbensis TaxID=172713 RepID=UPI000838A306|nr:IS110 family transposase [Paenibacillus kribbensis]